MIDWWINTIAAVSTVLLNPKEPKMKILYSPFNGGKYNLDHEVSVAELRRSGAAWLIDPFTGLSRTEMDINADPQGFLIADVSPELDVLSVKNKADYEAQLDALMWDKDALAKRLDAANSRAFELEAKLRLELRRGLGDTVAPPTDQRAKVALILFAGFTARYGTGVSVAEAYVEADRFLAYTPGSGPQ